MHAGLISTLLDPKLKPWTGAHGRYPDRICVAPRDHVAHGIPHKWIRFVELLRNWAMKLRLITKADLKRHLPRELPFRGRTLKLDYILRMSRQFVAFYGIENEKFGDALYIKRHPRRLLPKILREKLRDMYWRLVRRTRRSRALVAVSIETAARVMRRCMASERPAARTN